MRRRTYDPTNGNESTPDYTPDAELQNWIRDELALSFDLTESIALGSQLNEKQGDINLKYVLEPGTLAQDLPWVKRPADYAESTNEKVWKLLGVTKNGIPLIYNSVDDVWHEQQVGITAGVASLAISKSPNFIPSIGSLQTDLMAYYPMDEDAVSGDVHARDIGGGEYSLASTNSVLSVPGNVGNARELNTANSEYLSNAAHPFAFGDTDFTVAMWVKLKSKTADSILAGVWANSVGERSWFVSYDQSDDRFKFIASPDGTGSVNVLANAFGSPSVDTWYFVLIYYRAVANEMRIGVNNGSTNVAAHIGGAFSGSTQDFIIGSTGDLGATADAVIDEVGIWERQLTPAESTTLYTNGSLR